MFTTGRKKREFTGEMNPDNRAWPARGWLGLVLVVISWPLNWLLPGVRTAYLFFPLWLGYILVVDALVQRRAGNSIWSRRFVPKRFCGGREASWISGPVGG